SADGLIWERSPLAVSEQTELGPIGGGRQFLVAAFDTDQENVSLYLSADGQSWSRANWTMGKAGVGAILDLGTRYLAIGQILGGEDFVRGLWSSADGVDWELLPSGQPGSEDSALLGQAAIARGRIFAAGYFGITAP